MYTTTNYGFNIVEGTDMVNPLTQLNPNFTALDSDLKTVSDATVDAATCIKTGTVHAVTRTNTDAKVFRFTATGNWDTGDTMTVDGTLVSVFLPDGSAPTNGCFVINTEVIAAIQGTRVTLYVNAGDASNISFDDTSVSYTASNVQTAIEYASTAAGTEYSAGVSVADKITAMETNNVQSIPFTNAKLNNAYTLRFEKVGKVVELKTTLYATSDIAPNEVIGQAPAGFIPTTDVFGNTKGIDINIATDGSVTLKNTSAPLQAGVWYVLTMVYLV